MVPASVANLSPPVIRASRLKQWRHGTVTLIGKCSRLYSHHSDADVWYYLRVNPCATKCCKCFVICVWH